MSVFTGKGGIAIAAAAIGVGVAAAEGCTPFGNGSSDSSHTSPVPTPDQHPTQIPGTTVTRTETPQATATPTETVRSRYELAYQKEYQGPDIKVIFGIEKAVFDRPAGNTCLEDTPAANPRSFPCPPIKEIALSDEYLRQYAPEAYPNGMSQQEMLQRLNDAVLLGHLVNLAQKPEYKDLTLSQLKDLIRKGQAPEYGMSSRSGFLGSVDTSKPVLIVAMDKPGQVKGSTAVSFDYDVRNGSLVMGMWNGGSYRITDTSQFHSGSYSFALDLETGLVLPTISPISSATNDLERLRKELGDKTNAINQTLVPYRNGNSLASILSLH